VLFAGKWTFNFEELKRGNNLVSEQQTVRPNGLDKTFSCRKEHCGGNYGDRNRARGLVSSSEGIVPTEELPLTIPSTLAS